jgi:hypothetical protein
MGKYKGMDKSLRLGRRACPRCFSPRTESIIGLSAFLWGRQLISVS